MEGVDELIMTSPTLWTGWIHLHVNINIYGKIENGTGFKYDYTINTCTLSVLTKRTSQFYVYYIISQSIKAGEETNQENNIPVINM